MKQPKTILSFLWKFCAAYFGLILFFYATGAVNAVRDIYGGMGAGLLKNISSVAEVYVKPNGEKEAKNDLIFQIVSKASLKASKEQIRQKTRNGKENIDVLGFYTNSRKSFLLPILFFISLAIAYPSSISDKLRTMGTGLPLLLFYIFFKLACMLLLAIDNGNTYFPDYEFSAGVHWFLEIVDAFFIEAAFVIGLLIFILVGVKKDAKLALQ